MGSLFARNDISARWEKAKNNIFNFRSGDGADGDDGSDGDGSVGGSDGG